MSRDARPTPPADALSPDLARGLAQWRARWRVLGLIDSTLVALLAVLLLALAASLVDRFTFLGTGARSTLAVVVFGLPSAFWLAMAVRYVFFPRSPRWFLERVEERFAATRGFLLSAWELRASPEGAQVDSLVFRQRLQERAGELVRAVRPADVFPLRGSALPRLALAVAVALALHGAALAVPALGHRLSLSRLFDPSAPVARLSTARIVLPGERFVVAEGDDVRIPVEVSGTSSQTLRFQWRRADDVATNEPSELPIFTHAGEDIASASRGGVLSFGPSGDPATGGDSRRFVLVLERLRAPIRGSFRIADAESPDLRIDTAPRPVILSFEKTYHPPAYLGGAARAERSRDGDLRALEDSRVDVSVVADRPLTGAHALLEFEGGSTERRELQIDGDTARLRSLSLRGPGSYRVFVTAAGSGLSNRWSPTHAIRVDLDAPPAIALDQPRADRIVTPGDDVEVTLRVRDDLGLGSLLEEVRVDEGETLSRRVALLQGVRSRTWRGRLALAAMSLEFGQRIRLRYIVEDLKGSRAATPARTLLVGPDDVSTEEVALARSLGGTIDALRTVAVDVSRQGAVLRQWARRAATLDRRPRDETAIESVTSAARRIVLDLEALIERTGELESDLVRLLGEAGSARLRADLAAAHDALLGVLAGRQHAGRDVLVEIVQRASLPGRASDFTITPPLQTLAEVAASSWTRAGTEIELLAGDLAAIHRAWALDRGVERGLKPLHESLEPLLETPPAVSPLEAASAGSTARERRLAGFARAALEARVSVEILSTFRAATGQDPSAEELNEELHRFESRRSELARATPADDGIGNPVLWQAYRDVLERFVPAAESVRERVEFAASEARGHLREIRGAIASDLAQQATAFAKRREALRRAARREVERQVEFADPAADRDVQRAPGAGEALAAILDDADAASAIHLNVAGQPRIAAERDRVDAKIERFTAAAAADSSGTVARRAANDLVLLRRVLERVEALGGDLDERQLVERLRESHEEGDASAWLAALREVERVLDSANARAVGDVLRSAAEAYAVLGGAARLATLTDIGDELVDATQRLVDSLTARDEDRSTVSGWASWRVAEDAFDRFTSEASELRDRARASGAPDLAAALAPLDDSIETRAARDILRRVRADATRTSTSSAATSTKSTAALQLLELVERLARRVDTLGKEETPDILAARRALRDLAPGLHDEIERTLELARDAGASTEAAQETASESATQSAVDDERTAASATSALRERLGLHADSLDLTEPDALTRSRDVDVAIAALREPTPSAGEYLAAAAGARRVAARREALDGARNLQRERVATLELLRDRFGESSPRDRTQTAEALRELEEKLGLKEALETRYEALEELRGIHGEQVEVMRRTEREAEAPNVSDVALRELRAHQSSLASRLQDFAASSSRAQLALGELLQQRVAAARRQLEEALESRAELDARERQRQVESRSVLAELERRLQDLVGSLRGEISREMDRAARQRPDAQSAGRETIEDASRSLSRAAGELEAVLQIARDRQPAATVSARLQEALATLDAAAERIDRARQSVDPLSSPDVAAARREAVAAIDALRGRGRWLDRDRVDQAESGSRTLAELEGEQSELRRELGQITARKADSDDVRTISRLVVRERQVREELSRIDARVDAARREETLATSRRLEAYEELARDAILAARDLDQAAQARQLAGEEPDPALAQASDDLAWASQCFESRAHVRGGQHLDRALESFGDRPSRVAPCVDALVLAEVGVRQTAAEARELHDSLREHVTRREQRVEDLLEREEALARQVREAASSLDRAARHARALEDSRQAALDGAQEELREEALPALAESRRRLREAARLRDALETDGTHLPGERAAAAIERALRQLQESVARHERDPQGQAHTRAAGDVESAPSAESVARALDHMRGAEQELEQAAPGRAGDEQEGAVRSLADALQAGAASLSESRQQAQARSSSVAAASSSDSAEPTDREAEGEESGAVSQSGDPRGRTEMGEAEGTLDVEALSESIDRALGEGSWARLPSRLKRELLSGRREGIAPRYREAVEAYLRAVAAAAR